MEPKIKILVRELVQELLEERLILPDAVPEVTARILAVLEQQEHDHCQEWRDRLKDTNARCDRTEPCVYKVPVPKQDPDPAIPIDIDQTPITLLATLKEAVQNAGGDPDTVVYDPLVHALRVPDDALYLSVSHVPNLAVFNTWMDRVTARIRAEHAIPANED